MKARFLPCVILLGTVPLVTTVANAAEPAPAVLAAEQQRIETIARISKAAVAVIANDGRGGGSGVVISPDGYALTNFHVVKPAGEFMKCSMVDGRLYDAVIVGIDPTGDVALIKLLGRDDFPTAEFGDSDRVQVGDWCYVIGNPFLLATDFIPTVSYGMISGTHRYQPPAGTLLEYTDCLQTDAAVNPGNSGGPLFDSAGRLIGINGRCSFEKRGRVNVGVGYAISINQIKHFMGYLKSGRIVDHATLGATVTSDDQGRVVVENILESSDAYRRGLRYDDPLIRFGGRRISTVNGFKNVLGIYPKGWRVPMTFEHDGQEVTVQVRLAGVHSPDELIRKLRGARKPPQQKDPRPRNKPGDGRKDGSEPPKLRPGIPLPIPLPHGKARPPAPLPDHVAKLIKKRPGYANYYFNELNRDRVWSTFVSRQGSLAKGTDYTLSGSVAGGGIFTIGLTASGVSAQFPKGRFALDIKTDLDQQLVPDGSGGLLVALHLWHRLLTLGPKLFGEVYYLGTVPALDQQDLRDVLVGTHDVVEARFIFDPTSGLLTGLEMFPESHVDPCALHFSDYQDQGGRLLPRRIEVRYADQIVLDLSIDRLEMGVAQ